MTAKITEKDVQVGVTAFLELDGWRSIRTDPVSDRKRGKGFGEVGMPDYLYVRYWGKSPMWTDRGESNSHHMGDILWIEFKAPGKAPKAHQLNWHDAERTRGALVRVVDGFETFRSWYMNESGLNRRMLLR